MLLKPKEDILKQPLSYSPFSLTIQKNRVNKIYLKQLIIQNQEKPSPPITIEDNANNAKEDSNAVKK
jgi:hypothetical protein